MTTTTLPAIEEFDFILAGANFRPAETKTFIREELANGSDVTLERDPENPYDTNAIKVMADAGSGDSGPVEYFLGFVPKTDNLLLAQHLDAGNTFRCWVVSFVGDIKPVIRVSPDGTA